MKKAIIFVVGAALAVPTAFAVPALATGQDAAPVVVAPAVTSAVSVTDATTADYPATVKTVTSASAPSVKFGTTVPVSITVKAGVGTARGTVTLKVDGRTKTATLAGGKATVKVNGFDKGTYRGTVSYTPASGSSFKASSGSVVVKVAAAPTTTSLKSATVVRGKSPVVKLSTSKIGKATVTITGPRGYQVTRTVNVSKAYTTVSVTLSKKPTVAGTYKVTVKLTPPSTNFATSSASKQVRVR